MPSPVATQRTPSYATYATGRTDSTTDSSRSFASSFRNIFKFRRSKKDPIDRDSSPVSSIASSGPIKPYERQDTPAPYVHRTPAHAVTAHPSHHARAQTLQRPTMQHHLVISVTDQDPIGAGRKSTSDLPTPYRSSRAASNVSSTAPPKSPRSVITSVSHESHATDLYAPPRTSISAMSPSTFATSLLAPVQTSPSNHNFNITPLATVQPHTASTKRFSVFKGRKSRITENAFSDGGERDVAGGYGVSLSTVGEEDGDGDVVVMSALGDRPPSICTVSTLAEPADWSDAGSQVGRETEEVVRKQRRKGSKGSVEAGLVRRGGEKGKRPMSVVSVSDDWKSAVGGVGLNSPSPLMPMGLTPSVALPASSIASLAYTLGLTHLKSETTTPQTDAQAFAYFYSAAGHGHADAAYRLATMYATGRGVPPTSRISRGDAWRESSLRDGLDTSPRHSVSTSSSITLNGNGSPMSMGSSSSPLTPNPDPPAAIAMYKRAIEGGSADAMFDLAMAHLTGWGGLNRDDREGVRLLKMALDNGKTDAWFYLGWVYIREWEGFTSEDPSQQPLDIDPPEFLIYLTTTLDPIEDIIRKLPVPSIDVSTPDGYTFTSTESILTPSPEKSLTYLLTTLHLATTTPPPTIPLSHQVHSQTLHILSHILLHPHSPLPSPTHALPLLIHAARAPYTPAELSLAHLLLRSPHPECQAKCAGWFWRAARGGDVGAARMLAELYREGRGVSVDLERSAEWEGVAEALEGGEAGKVGGTGVEEGFRGVGVEVVEWVRRKWVDDDEGSEEEEEPGEEVENGDEEGDVGEEEEEEEGNSSGSGSGSGDASGSEKSSVSPSSSK
ncbi:hypothetical protein HDV00_005819 [Rhizophlyctis rosea]|nr:hypothetical protein HDV00_005819 [Rhizophlyctis rosea]